MKKQKLFRLYKFYRAKDYYDAEFIVNKHARQGDVLESVQPYPGIKYHWLIIMRGTEHVNAIE